MRERLALVFLVLLRIVIGWHFFFEGYQKVSSVHRGPTETNRPWTSESFFREGTGPIAALVRSQIGDTDDLVLARLDIRPVPAGEDPTKYPDYKRMPAALDREWDQYLDRFVKAYGLGPAEQDVAAKTLQQQKEKLVKAFTTVRKDYKRTYPSGTLDVQMTVAERAAEYRKKLSEYRTAQGDKLFAMGKDVEKARRPALRAEVMSLRAELIKEIDAQTAEMKKALEDSVKPAVSVQHTVTLPDAQEKPRLIAWIDWTTRWGLIVIGACLLLGLFSRSASFAGALFLLMTILTAPSLPWLPVPPQSEGNYVFVSKNVIEMVALFMLAFMPTGKWFGIDALISSFFKRNDQDA